MSIPILYHVEKFDCFYDHLFCRLFPSLPPFFPPPKKKKNYFFSVPVYVCMHVLYMRDVEARGDT